MEDWTGRAFAIETVRETFRLDRSVGELALSRFPVVLVQAVAMDGADLDLTECEVDGDTGLLIRFGTSGNVARWSAGRVAVTYAAGFPIIPAPARRAVVALVVGRWHARGRDPAMKSTTVVDVLTESYWTPPSDDGLRFANSVADKDGAENQKLTKERSRGRIDGAVAACMALGRAAAKTDTGRSIYDLDLPDEAFFV